jgi:hypothetical protein
MKYLNGESTLAPLIEGENKNEIQAPLNYVFVEDEGI